MALAELIDQIDKLTVLELADLVKQLEEKYGVSAAAPVAMMAAAPGAAAAPAAIPRLAPKWKSPRRKSPFSNPAKN